MGYSFRKMSDGLIDMGKWTDFLYVVPPFRGIDITIMYIKEEAFNTKKFMPINFEKMQAYHKNIFYCLKKTMSIFYMNIKNNYFPTTYINGDYLITKLVYNKNFKLYCRREMPGKSYPPNKPHLGTVYDSVMVQLQKTYQIEGNTIVKRNMVMFKHHNLFAFIIERTYDIETRQLNGFAWHPVTITKPSQDSNDMKINEEPMLGLRPPGQVFLHNYKNKPGGRNLSEKTLSKVLNSNPTTCPLKFDNPLPDEKKSPYLSSKNLESAMTRLY